MDDIMVRRNEHMVRKEATKRERSFLLLCKTLLEKLSKLTTALILSKASVPKDLSSISLCPTRVHIL